MIIIVYLPAAKLPLPTAPTTTRINVLTPSNTLKTVKSWQSAETRPTITQ
jgi:hypothetical protein